MTMSRSLRACRLTAGKFAAVDLPTFLAVCCHFLFCDNCSEFSCSRARTHTHTQRNVSHLSVEISHNTTQNRDTKLSLWFNGFL